MAKSLNQARREAAERTQESISRMDFDYEPEDTHATLMWLDYRKLRGLPAIGKGVSGHPTDSFVPGSDEHLEQIA